MSRTHTRVPLTPLRVLADGLLLLLLLLGAVFSVQSVFQLDVQLLWLAGGLVVLGLAALAVFSLPRWRWAVLLVLAALYALLLWRTWPIFSLGEVAVRCTVVNFFARAFPFLERITPVAQISAAAWQQVTTYFCLVAAAPLAALLGFGIVRLRSLWVPFWGTFPLIAMPLFLTRAPAWPPLMALVGGWCVLVLVSSVEKRDVNGGARLTLIALPAVAALLALLTVLLPQTGYVQPRWAARAQTALLGSLSQLRWDALLQGTVPGLSDGGSGMAAGTEEIDLSAAGPLRATGKTVLKVQSDLPGKTYLRGYSTAQYTGTGWVPLPEERYGSADAAPWPETFEPLNGPARAAPGTYYPITVENVGAPAGCVYFPYQLVTAPAELAGAAFVRDSYLARARNVRKHTLYYQANAAPTDPASFRTRTEDLAELAYRDFVYANYVDCGDQLPALHAWMRKTSAQLSDAYLPDAVQTVLRDLPERIAVQLAAVWQLSELLATSTAYDLNTPTTPAGADFVDYFLNTSKKGYCMHYASAATLLLRSLRIPARYVSGYVVDLPAGGEMVAVPDSAAHAWVEIYLDGYGWYPVDMTPGESGRVPPWAMTTEAPPNAVPAPTPTPTAPTASAAPSQAQPDPSAPNPTPAIGTEGNGTAPFHLRLLWLPVALLCVLAAFLLRRALAEGLRVRQFHAPDCNAAVLAAYRYLQKLRRWGASVPRAAERLAQKARFSQHNLTEEERDEMLALVGEQAHKTDVALSVFKRLWYRYGAGLF